MWNELRGFWRNYTLSWARLGKDRRAWPVFVRGTFLLVWIPFCLLLNAGLILPKGQRAPQFFFNSLVWGLGFIAFLGIRRLNRRDDAFLNISITGVEFAAPTSNEIDSNVCAYLGERMLIVSSLLARALNEIAAHADNRPSPDNVARQVLKQTLRQRELWVKLEPAEAELAALPQGDWSPNDNNLALEWAEQLRLLRWVFQLDGELQPLALVPHWDGLLTREFLVGSRIESFNLSRTPWEVRLERDSAQLYLARTLAELEARNLLPPTLAIEGLPELRASLAGASTDLLVGEQAIEELSETDLRTFSATALARFNYAAYLAELLETSEVMSFSHWLQRPFESGP